MDWVVTVSPNETASGELAPETEKAAHAAFEEHGYLAVLRCLRSDDPLPTLRP
jgi:hypothetical protein